MTTITPARIAWDSVQTGLPAHRAATPLKTLRRAITAADADTADDVLALIVRAAEVSAAVAYANAWAERPISGYRRRDALRDAIYAAKADG